MKLATPPSPISGLLFIRFIRCVCTEATPPVVLDAKLFSWHQLSQSISFLSRHARSNTTSRSENVQIPKHTKLLIPKKSYRNPCEVARQHRAAGTALAGQTLCCQIENSLCSSLCVIISRISFFWKNVCIFCHYRTNEVTIVAAARTLHTRHHHTWLPLLWLQMHAVLFGLKLPEGKKKRIYIIYCFIYNEYCGGWDIG